MSDRQQQRVPRLDGVGTLIFLMVAFSPLLLVGLVNMATERLKRRFSA